MRLEPPRWWYGSSASDRLTAALLTPAGWLYGAAAETRFALAKPYRSTLPVVCVGNFTVGGAGKTPIALALAELLRNEGHHPAFLTRGYGGEIAGPHWVREARDMSAEVGDEPLLLARAAPTMLARDRPAGARAIEASGASLIIMDDGFQNPSLAKDLALIAVDAGAGLGNGRVFPAGPLRTALRRQIKRASAAIVIGDHGMRHLELDGTLPVIAAKLSPAEDTDWLRGAPVLAFSGIGRPGKFFASLEQCGAKLIETRAFPDHHIYSSAEALDLLETAERSGARLVTTEKDKVRLGGLSGPVAALAAEARTLPVRLELADESRERLLDLLRDVLPGR